MANFNFNKCFFGGRLTADPKIAKTGESKTKCAFTIAINMSKENTVFVNAVSFGQCAEFINKYFKKGSSIFVSGSFARYTDKENKEHTSFIIDTANFVDSKNEKKSDNTEGNKNDLPY